MTGNTFPENIHLVFVIYFIKNINMTKLLMFNSPELCIKLMKAL